MFKYFSKIIFSLTTLLISCSFFLSLAQEPAVSHDMGEETVAREEVSIPELCISGIIFDEDNPIAIVNGKSLGLGGVV
tara:strand:- start:219 stop:452 length:234 start_codon:yes stop_codon:yes gene_type:complete